MKIFLTHFFRFFMAMEVDRRMDARFFLNLVLIGVVLFLCYWFRNEDHTDE